MTTTTTLENLVDTVGEYKTLEDGFWHHYMENLGIGQDRKVIDRFHQRYLANLALRQDAQDRVIRHMQAKNLVTAHGEHFSVTLVATDAYGRTHQLEITKK